MHELEDRWVLPIAGDVVHRCCIDEAVTIELSDGDTADATILILGTFEFQSAERHWDKFWRPSSKRQAIRFAPGHALSGLKVERAEAHKDGTLDMSFGDGSRLRVLRHAKYEAWEFIGRHGAKAIALPGGDVAIWRSAA